MDLSQALQLPPVSYQKAHAEPDMGGLSFLLKKRLGLPFTPLSPVSWQHAWVYGTPQTAEHIFGTRYAQERPFHLVATQAHKHRLSALGYLHTEAVGYPYVYLDQLNDQRAERIPGSLLVMPPHSLKDTEERWEEAQLVERIADYRSYFSTVVFCIHYRCLQKRYWIDTLNRFGIDYVIGYDHHDRNGLWRMHRIFQLFEYMTTNTWGSHPLYAACSGVKVSVIRPFFQKNIDMYRKMHPKGVEDPYYLLRRQLLESANYDNLKQQYPFFFCEPPQAADHREWALKEAGDENRKPLPVLKKLLHWNFTGQIIGIKDYGLRALKAYFPQ